MDFKLTCNTPDEVLFAHVRQNSAGPYPWVSQKGAHAGHVCLVGGGPSLADNLASLRARIRHGQQVFALNGACRFLNEHEIVPDAQIVMDARPGQLGLLGKAHAHYLASQVDPELFEAVKSPILWHHAAEGMDEVVPVDRTHALIGGSPSVGLAAMCLAYALGYRNIHLYGYDSSHKDGAGHAYAQADDPLCKVELGGKTFVSTLTMAGQADNFPNLCASLNEAGCTITYDGAGLMAEVVYQMSHGG